MKVELIDHMGSDLSVVNAARVSFDKESEWELFGYRQKVDVDKPSPIYKLADRDVKLINYLAKHNHWTPFGHCYATFRIKAPIFVARQLGKHQVGLVWNEVSRRYVDSEPEFFTPDVWRKRADNVKQGSSDEAVTKVAIRRIDGCDNTYPIAEVYEYIRAEALRKYKSFIASGVCPEQARLVLPQSMMTEWWWSGSIAAFARVCKLRLDPHTQKETRDIAELISNKLKTIFPVSWDALMGDA
jgi:thymidylate synthase (FAD)